MPLPYRALWTLPPSRNVIATAKDELASWLVGKGLSAEQRTQLGSGEFLAPGIHPLNDVAELSVAAEDHVEDASRRQLFRFVETNQAGTWQVQLLAIDHPGGSGCHDTLLVESTRIDQPTATGLADPPRLVKRLLERERVFDGAAEITPEPRLIHADEVPDVAEAILDPRRSVSVIVAGSLGTASETEFSACIARLTRLAIGTTSVLVLDQAATHSLNDLLPDPYQVSRGRVRTFLPKVDLDDPLDSRRHRVLGPSTFATAISDGRVSHRLQSAFAETIRRSLLEQTLPRDIRHALTQLQKQLSEFRQTTQIQLRAKQTPTISIVQPPQQQTLSDLVPLLTRWKIREGDNPIEAINQFIGEQISTADWFMNHAAALEDQLSIAQEKFDDLQEEFENGEFPLAELETDIGNLQRTVSFLRKLLNSAGADTENTSTPSSESEWSEPEDVVELARRLTPGAKENQTSPVGIEFTGDMAPVEEVMKRDPLGRYVSAFWNCVHVLHDYLELKRAGEFRGNVHTYLTDDSVAGLKCSASRHASTESDSVLSNGKWRAERVLPVPRAVSPTGSMLMTSHFRAPGHGSFAPRMYYFDDIAKTGKIYIGYIGRHLTNTRTARC